MAKKITWTNLPVTVPGGSMMPHMSGRMRMAVVDAVFEMTGGTERLADWADKPENYGEFITKVWAKGVSRPLSVEHTADDSLEGLLARLDAGEHARVVSPGGLGAENAIIDADSEEED